MTTTTNLGITLVEQSQAQKEITINEAIRALDAMVGNSVLDKDLATPPGSPTSGAAYIIAASPTGAWSGKATYIAYFDQIWRFITPQTGMLLWVKDESSHYKFNGTAWVIVSSGGGGGGITGPGSSTSTALARWSGTGGAALLNSGVLLDGSNNMSGIGTLISAAHTITSTSTTALAVGANGATNPALTVDASTASSATGIAIKSAAASGGVTVTATSSAASENITFSSKGTGSAATLNGGTTTYLAAAGAPGLVLGQGSITFQTSFRGYTANTAFFFFGTPDSNLTASTEAMNFDVNVSQTKTHDTSAIMAQRDIRFRPSTHAFAGASTITNAMGLSVDGAVIAGTNATITNSSTIHSGGNAVGSGVTNSYGLNLTANTGATNNYITSLNGSAGEVLRLRTDGQIALLATNTAAGTNGAQTINKPSGTVNFAAAAASLVVTNSLVTTSSIVFAVVRTNDSTAVIKNVVPAAGSFTITLNAAATAATSVGFLVIN